MVLIYSFTFNYLVQTVILSFNTNIRKTNLYMSIYIYKPKDKLDKYDNKLKIERQGETN